ncbi:MAG: valine--tRNA ligase [Patescibacteria group bacterium]
MDKRFDHTQVEEKIYSRWEQTGCFQASINPEKQPFTIILPPPNANADLHAGHAMFVYEDVMIRYQKLQGKEVLWLPGFDHAGFETQFVFEKHLKKQKKSRFDYDRETLYQMIWDFVEENKPKMRSQLKRLGFALDWSKEQFTIDPEIVALTYKTFKRLFDEGRLYRKERLVNYCTRCGTSFSDLEVDYQEQESKLWYIRYPLEGTDSGEKSSITVATTRPETMLGDTAVAVHPDDERYARFIGKKVRLPLINREIPIIADEMVDPKFGTGAVKITPAHDDNDWQVAQRHKLPLIQVIGYDGRLTSAAAQFAGLKVKPAREAIVSALQENGMLEKEKKHVHRVGICYKSGDVIEPLPLEQWFIDIKPLAQKAKNLIQDNKVRFYPKKYKRQAIQILENYHDWNISRQIVWGIRIPAFQKVDTGEWVVEIDPEKQRQMVADGSYVQDTDTFDTWFSSGQWPFATLQNLGTDEEGRSYFDYFYPSSIMETGHDILRAWVARMIMLGEYMTEKEPFQEVFLHGMVRDKHGQKMSKSKGNVINPVEFLDKYGADALRAALLFGTKDGGDTNISEEKVRGMRNFGNKIWNMGRFLWMNQEDKSASSDLGDDVRQILQELSEEYSSIEKEYHKNMRSHAYSKGFDLCYHFLWHRFADHYIEALKEEMRAGNTEVLENLKRVYFSMLVLLHPFMPFVTEAVWKVFHGEESSIFTSHKLKK